MGVMEKMRNSTSAILWLLIVSFGLLWVLSDVDFFGAIQAGPNALGSVNGEKITNEEYQQRVQYYTTAYSQQKVQEFTSVWLEELREGADIVDNRSRLLR